MKFLERLSIVIFSFVILIISILLILSMFNLVGANIVSDAIDALKYNEIGFNTTVSVSVICILLAIKNIFFSSFRKKKNKPQNGVLLQNANGKLLVSNEALENLVTSVVTNVHGAENSSVKIFFDEGQNVTINVILFVEENMVIKDVSTNLQNKIKSAVQNAIDLNIKEVNVSVKNIIPKEEKKKVSSEV